MMALSANSRLKEGERKMSVRSDSMKRHMAAVWVINSLSGGMMKSMTEKEILEYYDSVYSSMGLVGKALDRKKGGK